MVWMENNDRAQPRSGEGVRAHHQVAAEFDDIVRSVLAQQRSGTTPDQNIIGEVLPGLRGRAPARPTPRSFRACATGSLAATSAPSRCPPELLVRHLASRDKLSPTLARGHPGCELDLVVDKVLRIDDPFVTNRGVATGPSTSVRIQAPGGYRGSSCTEHARIHR